MDDRTPLRHAHPVLWGLRVMRGYVRIGMVRKSQFRWEFINQVVMDLLFYVSFVLTFQILYGLEGADAGDGASGLMLGGWNYAEMKVFLGMAFVADALMMTFIGQTWHFGTDLKNGSLDPFKVRPGPTAFLYMFQRFSPEGLMNLVIATGWLIYALVPLVPERIGALHLAWSLPLAIASIAWVRPFLSIAYNTIELWILDSGLGHVLSMIFTQIGERPLDVYPSLLRRAALFVIPVAGIAWYPASLVLGRLGPLAAFGYPLVLVAFGYGSAWLFKRGLRNYDSAMG